MKQKLLILLCAIMATVSAGAIDFTYYYNDIALYFNKTSETTCELASIYSSSGGDIVIPSTVSYNSKSFTVTSIGDRALNDSKVTSVELPNTIVSIGVGAFGGKLTSIIIPDSVTSIGERAFDGCKNLTTVVLPNSLTSIEPLLFAYCSSLISIEIPESVTTIGHDAFLGCEALTSIVIPDSVTSIGQDAFYNCYGLVSVELPNSITTISSGTFCYCSSLTAIDIPQSVTSIGSSAFNDCTNLKSIKVHNDNPSAISLGYRTFYNVPIYSCILYVPKGSKELYQASDRWKDFKNIEEFEPEPVPEVKGDINGDGVVDVRDINALIEIILSE